MAHSGKRVVKARDGIDRIKLYPLAEAVTMVKARANAKFDETVEIAMNLGVDPKHADQMVRGFVGSVTQAQVREIAEKKMPDLNCSSVDSAVTMIKGSARAMGLQVVE